MRRWPLICFILAAFAWPGVAVAAPSEVQRILRVIDFEERRLGNPEDLPMFWEKVQGPGHPPYIRGRLTTDAAASGRYSFRLDLNGGSLSYRYAPEDLRAQVAAHYRVEARVRTTSLRHARARLSAAALDVLGHVIPSTRVSSDPFVTTPASPDWHTLSIIVAADDPRAARLEITLELLQAEKHRATSLGQRAIPPLDIRGTAWFDDVTVAQVPQVRITTDRPGNIFPAGGPATLNVALSDRFTDDLAAQLIVRDAAGRLVFQRSGALDISQARTTGPGQKLMGVQLPDLPPGWYEASLVMTSRGQRLGEQTVRLILLADRAAPVRSDPRFGLIATDLPMEGWNDLPEILRQLGAGRVKLAVWSRRGDATRIDPKGFDNLLLRLREQHITPTACLLEPPPELQLGLSRGQPWTALLNADPERWQPQLAFLISRHASHLDRWQIGPDGADDFVRRGPMRDVYDLVHKQFAQLSDRPDLAMPWPAWYELEKDLPATVGLYIPPAILPDQIPHYIRELRERRGGRMSLSLDPIDPDIYGREAQLRDLAQRVLWSLAAGAERIDLPLPFDVRLERAEAVKQPSELLMVYRTLMRALGGARFEGRVPIAEGVEAMLFDRDGQGILAVWDRARGQPRAVSMELGPAPIAVDLWGRTIRLAAGDGRGGESIVPVGPLPLLVVNMDAHLIRLRASVGIDRPLVESSFRPHARKLRFTNPWRQSVSGVVRLSGPRGWTLNPSVIPFTAGSQETIERDISLEIPYNSVAGPQQIIAAFDIQADRQATASIPLTVTLGLGDVGMQSLAIREGDDVFVQQMITNYSDKPINYMAFCVYPGQARQERLVINLGAGQTTLKRYRFPAAAADAAARVRVGVKELEGSRILNDEIEVR